MNTLLYDFIIKISYQHIIIKSQLVTKKYIYINHDNQ